MAIPLTELIERYERLSSPVIYDILDTMGYPNQALSADIRPLDPKMVLAGPAFTIDGYTLTPDLVTDFNSYEPFRHIESGSVLVLATNGHNISGPWGENTSISAQVKGARGIIIDGGTRDAGPVLELDMPFFCRFVTPVFGRNRFAWTGFQVPVQVAGQVEEKVAVDPGSFVIADWDGVVIVPQPLIEEVLIAGEKLEEVEVKLREGLLAGEDRELVYKRFPKFDHVRRAKE
jgi:regulator of RNase E activity RraA